MSSEPDVSSIRAAVSERSAALPLEEDGVADRAAPRPRRFRWVRKHPTLMGELSYRPGLVEGGRLGPAWKALLSEASERFVVGSDTWTNGRWPQYEALMEEARRWLGELAPDAARRIAWDNAARLFGLKPPE